MAGKKQLHLFRCRNERRRNRGLLGYVHPTLIELTSLALLWDPWLRFLDEVSLG